jgi:hypothetical protein
MKKLFTYLSIAFLAVLVAFSGCSSGTDASANGVKLSAFNGGDKALNLEFSPTAPPATVRDMGQIPFSVSVLVENKGEFDIELGKAHVVLSGFNAADLGLNSTSKELISLNGVKKKGSNIIPGAKVPVTFSDMRYMPNIVSGTFPMTLYASVCYPYRTQSLIELCVSGNTESVVDTKSKVCDVNNQKSKYANSGAPVQIANVKQYPASQSSIQLQFDIVHTGKTKGSLYAQGSLDSDCKVRGISPTSAEAQLDKDKVKFAIDAGGLKVDCGNSAPSGTVTLMGDKYTVTCIVDTNGQEDYVRPISLTLEYDYLDRISKSITVEHVGN